VVTASTSTASTVTVTTTTTPTTPPATVYITITPTAVNAGTGGQAHPRDILGLMAILAGLGATVVGAGWLLARRQNGAHL
jgi:uncharacterized protein HemX